MMKNRKPQASIWMVLILLLVHLFVLAGCSQAEPEVEQTSEPTQATVPNESEAHEHTFVDGLCECGESNGLDGFTVETESGLSEVQREDTDAGMVLTSTNPAGQMQSIRLIKAVDAAYGRYYEVVYNFTSNVAGTVRFVSDGAAYYETNEFEVKEGENQIAVRFAAGQAKDGKVNACLELGALEQFNITVTGVTCEELTENLSAYFLDVAAEKASGSMQTNKDGHLAATFNTEEGWRVKLAVDRTLVKGKTYETTFVFTKSGGKDQNVTYTVYDGAATIIGSKTKWVDSDVCVATFYFTANENVTKGTCLELGQLCDGEDVSLTFTYVDFKEVSQEKLAKLQAQNPFPGVNVWTEGALTPATGTQSADGLTLVNTNAATDWWKVKLEQDMPADKGGYYCVTFKFTSDASGRIKFVNDNATYYGSNEYDVMPGDNTFSVELQSGGNTYSCLELGGLGPCELVFTDITVEKIEKPEKSPVTPGSDSQTTGTRFGSFNVWTDSSVQKLTRTDTATTLTLTSKNAQTDWWKVKLEKDIIGTAGQWYEVTYAFTSDATGRIKFVNDDAAYYGSNEHDVVVGKNTFSIKFKFGGKPYSCLELGGLGQFKLVFTNYSLKKIEAPQIVTNGFEAYKTWTESSMNPLTREDTANTMTLISDNAAGDWWKVKLEQSLATEPGKTYKLAYKFTSDVEGDIKFGTNENVTCHTADVHHVAVGENTFEVIFTPGDGAYTCLELGGLGQFRLTFTEITLAESEVPQQPEQPDLPDDPEHTHDFVNGVCECGEKNGFETYQTWTEGAMNPLKREDTENSMTLISDNASADWWKVKLENGFALDAGKTYEAVYVFTSDAEGDIKFGTNENVTVGTADVYHVVVGENRFAVTFTAADGAYTCLELGGLGAFHLTFTEISLTEAGASHTHSFVNGVCECGEKNGFETYQTWTEGALNSLKREDTENSMTLISDNASADWWKVKLENGFALEAGKTYEAVYVFTSDAEGDIKFGTNENVAVSTADVYHVVVGENRFAVTFTAADGAYTCLEMGGLGAFHLTFTEISLTEAGASHTHSFVNGMCECGEKNGFETYQTWTEGALNPLKREDTENSMTLISDNASADWWKVKLEWPLTVEEGKTYEATFAFTSNVAGTIKYSANSANFLGKQEYDVVVGENTFKVQFTAGAENYSCLEMGGLGAFQLTFTEISLTEAGASHTHTFVNGACSCGEENGFAGVGIWTEGALNPLKREDAENSMTLTSDNASADWWKVKLEWPLSVENGKTYKVTFKFNSNVSGLIKYSVNAALFHNNQEYNVQVGENTFTTSFTAGAENYSCLELGGLGAFTLTFTEVSLQETA